MDNVPADISLPQPFQYPSGSEPVHSYSLERKGRKWLTLFINRLARSSVPVFREGQPISGRVELDLKKPEILKGVTVDVKASTTVLDKNELVFLELNKPLWTPVRANTKISGKHSWPFEIQLPREISVSEGKRKKEKIYHLPPTFSEKGSAGYIEYWIIVTVRRGTFKSDDMLSTKFAYIPNIIPAPPSELRRLAYDQGLPIFDPEADPEGWKILPKVVVQSTSFDSQKVEVECTLAIAKPLCYAPGSPLPLHLTLKSDNIKALDLLCSPNAVRLQLFRSLGYGPGATEIAIESRSNNILVSVMAVGQANFWPRESSEQRHYERRLQGELEVANNLKPSFIFPRLSIVYHLKMIPFAANEFRSADTKVEEGALLSQEVEIATQHTPGILPHSSIPPAYKLAKQTDYTKSVGLLERFLGSGCLP